MKKTNLDKIAEERYQETALEFVNTVMKGGKLEYGDKFSFSEEDVYAKYREAILDKSTLTELYEKAKNAIKIQFTRNGADEPSFPEDISPDKDAFTAHSLLMCIGMLWEFMPPDNDDCKDLVAMVHNTIENTFYNFLMGYAMVATRDFRGACV